ncbi:MAG: excinuclease ABC subunit UvrB [Clostridia bacterium]|nr:excinuclease ABC subunit UvrB [Clostridia bacterium]
MDTSKGGERTERFELHAPFAPTGDQPEAIEALTRGLQAGLKEQVLLGVTGSGKTFTMANVIANVNRPTLVLAHNKTLAAQLCSEFREFFPNNAVEYFVSYYDYYQPEAYIPGKDMYIEKDALINDEIDKLRHSATSALFERRDVIIVSSVSCIYSLGSPLEYKRQVIGLRVGMNISRDAVASKLVDVKYERNDMNFVRNNFRMRGDVLEVYPSGYSEKAIRIEFFGDEIDRISEINPLTGAVNADLNYVPIYPATHYVIDQDRKEDVITQILLEMDERVDYFRSQNKLLEAQRIEERTRYDVEMIREIGYCSGIENYSRIFAGREPGSTPFTLLDYFPDDFVLFVDESHATLPQVRGMSGGDVARKKNLVEFGFRLPSAYDNRPLYFEEFEKKLGQVICVSATPAEFELSRADQVVEQIIRPTGLLDPEVEVRPVETQIDDLIGEINERVSRGERVIVTTLTTKMAEDLTDYLEGHDISVKYIHHEVETMERMEILRDLRIGAFDVIVGINLLREGIDLPEVTLVAILDADKEGFLRSETSLIQMIGRAARNAGGKVIMYADRVTDSMKRAIDETARRRKMQSEYNEKHGVTPQTVRKDVRELISIGAAEDRGRGKGRGKRPERAPTPATAKEKDRLIAQLEGEMKEAAKLLRFEEAAYLRDRIKELKGTK